MSTPPQLLYPTRQRFSSRRPGTDEALFGFIGQRTELPCRVAGGLVLLDHRLGHEARGRALTAEKTGSDRKKAVPAAQSKNKDMGSALRSVYQKTVEENVPDDLLALLGKLD